ncbi:hypothetical protein ACFOZ7_12130 [Natribaculum luteum]|uniref:DNA-binding protein n=1 Tax=Natribaculum luteum TaxID=1586232 RepID=A0ABD5P100_9EURY|nr:hypothetical protein [Natribaculum luteum]
MPPREPYGQRGRLLAALVLLAVLAGFLVWDGTATADPSLNQFPDDEAVVNEPRAYVDERVVLGGRVVDTDPVVVEISHTGDSRTVTLEDVDATVQNADRALKRGDEVSAFGTLENPSTLATERTIVRESWELQYMYVVSLLGGLWVLGRFVRGWRFDREQLAFVPRERPRPLRNRFQPRPSETSHTETATGEAGRTRVTTGGDSDA